MARFGFSASRVSSSAAVPWAPSAARASASQRRAGDAAAGAGPERRLLAGRGRIGGDGGGAVLGRADFRGGRQRGEGGEEEEAAHGRGLARGAMRTLVTLGHGYSAAALAASLAGWRVVGTTRSPREGGGDAGRRGRAGRLGRPRGGRPGDRRRRRAAGVAAARRRRRPGAGAPRRRAGGRRGRTGSATSRPPGVYGDRQGGWVDEESALEPSGERGRRRVAAEAAWRRPGCRCTISGWPGSTGRGAACSTACAPGGRSGWSSPGQVFSRIHVADVGARARRLARPPGPRARLQRRRRPAGAARGRDRLRRRLLGMPVPPTVPFEDGEAVADGASFWPEFEAGREPADQGRARGRARLPGLSRPDSRAVLAAGG